jgi:hypothetical protein
MPHRKDINFKNVRILVVRQQTSNFVQDYPEICTSPTSSNFGEGVQVMNAYAAHELKIEMQRKYPNHKYRIYKLVEEKHFVPNKNNE